MTFPRLRQLVIASDTTDTIDQLIDIFRLEAPFPDPGVAEFGLVNGVFAIGDQFLEVVVPVVETAPAARFMARGGPGGYMAIFEVEDIAATRTRVDAAGMRRVWDIDLKDISASHIHPADVGGAIVSVDQPRPAGDWRWGGPDWNKRSAVGRLLGAELTSPDPVRLMARWASATGAKGSGNALHFDEGDITFIEGESDRLVAFDLMLPDVPGIISRAKAVGLETDGTTVSFAGVEMRLGR